MAKHPQALLKRHRLQANKGFGQNFLVPGVAERIAAAARLSPEDWVVEVGPGMGALTEALCDRVARVIAVEKDPAMIGILREELGERPNLEILRGDARAVDLAPIAARAGRRLRLVGNIPYYVSSPLLRAAVQMREHLLDVTFTVQREVAERVAAPPGSRTYGALSVLIGAFADATIVLRLPPGAFHPPPKIDSAVLRLVFLPVPRTAAAADLGWFEKVVFAAFGHRRKMILNSLKDSPLELGKPVLEAALAEAGIESTRRAETVSVEEFGRLADAIRRTATPPA